MLWFLQHIIQSWIVYFVFFSVDQSSFLFRKSEQQQWYDVSVISLTVTVNFDCMLPLLKGDVEFATRCHQAFLDGQVALDNFLWNKTTQHYNAYSTFGFDYEKLVNATHLEVCGHGVSDAGADNKTDAQDENPAGQMCLEGDPASPGAIMTDSFYSQVGNTKFM